MHAELPLSCSIPCTRTRYNNYSLKDDDDNEDDDGARAQQQEQHRIQRTTTPECPGHGVENIVYTPPPLHTVTVVHECARSIRARAHIAKYDRHPVQARACAL